jgi:hypothetical protein
MLLINSDEYIDMQANHVGNVARRLLIIACATVAFLMLAQTGAYATEEASERPSNPFYQYLHLVPAPGQMPVICHWDKLSEALAHYSKHEQAELDAMVQRKECVPLAEGTRYFVLSVESDTVFVVDEKSGTDKSKGAHGKASQFQLALTAGPKVPLKVGMIVREIPHTFLPHSKSESGAYAAYGRWVALGKPSIGLTHSGTAGIEDYRVLAIKGPFALYTTTDRVVYYWGPIDSLAPTMLSPNQIATLRGNTLATGKIKICKSQSVVFKESLPVAFPPSGYVGICRSQGPCRHIEVYALGASLDASRRACTILDADLIVDDGQPLKVGEELHPQYAIPGFEPVITVYASFK